MNMNVIMSQYSYGYKCYYPSPIPLLLRCTTTNNNKNPHCSLSFASLPLSDSPDAGVKIATEANTVLSSEGIKERIRKLFNNKVELSVSSYDTAWVAMVPSPHYSLEPCFPECVDWLLDNQLANGSWGLPRHSPLLLKDTLSSTLACILALKQWGVGEDHINKGLHFMESNFPSAIDKNQHSPTGFDIIFPGMLDYAKDLDLKLPLDPTVLNAMLRYRELELKRCYEMQPEETEAYLAYVSEGTGKLQDWEMVIKKYQRKNGSLFNSPATTAAALTHHHLQDAGCLNYIRLLLDKFGNAVPTVYPLDIYARLCMIDNLERLGIDWHFREEIRSVLDETYSCWLQGDEQIFMDVATCAIAFRVLRMNGYDVSADPLTQITKEESYFNSVGGHLKGISDALELYRASQLIISPDESALRKQNLQSSHFLKQTLSDGSVWSDKLSKYISQEMDDALKFPFYSSLERMANRRNIEHYNVDSSTIRVLKSSYCSSNIGNKDFLKLAIEDFNICQSIHREEIEHLERWVIENRLDKLNFARQKTEYASFSAAATIFSPELSDARMSWAKSAVLTTVVDDFFDVGGSVQELVNLIQLVEKWDVNIESDCCSEQVRIVFSALRRGISEIADQALICQRRSVTSHIVEIWLDLLKSMFREAEWSRDGYVPTMDEYMENGYVSFAIGPIVLPALYVVGPKLSEEAARSSEVNKLFKLMSNCGRLLNDIQGFKRELEEGKLNAISLRMIHGGGETTKEEAVKEARRIVESQKEQLLRLVVKEKGSMVPRACKELFWKMTKVVHQFYFEDDGFTSEDMMKAVKDIIHRPIACHLDDEFPIIS
ncbi:hypothetical protein LguiA_016818 [Lonicera macranthoides]